MVIGEWIAKTLKLYLIWSFIYLPFAIYGFWLDGLPFWKSAILWIRNIVFRGENYLSWPLWYLLGLLHAGVIIWIFAKLKLSFWNLCIVAAAFYVIPKLVDLNSFGLWTKLMRTTGDGFTVGLPLMTLGALIRKIFPSIKGWNKDDYFFRHSLIFRFFSVHIYLIHMLFAGCFVIFLPLERGILYWSITTALAMISGAIMLNFPSAQRFLYGRVYSLSR